jgi:hypothetical protein
VPLEAVEGGVERAVREGGKAGNAQVDPNRVAFGNGLLDLALCLDGNELLASAHADGDVPDLTQHFAAIAIAQPAELWQEQAAIRLVELDLGSG